MIKLGKYFFFINQSNSLNRTYITSFELKILNHSNNKGFIINSIIILFIQLTCNKDSYRRILSFRQQLTINEFNDLSLLP
jgi:hypothetical protein